jgi:methionyl-tRNA formyltransferase
VVDNLARGLGAPRRQEGETTYAHKIEPAELQLDWTRPALDLHRLVRIGGAWTTFRGKRLKVWRTTLEPAADGTVPAPTGSGVLHLVEVQPEGKPRMPARAWANGARWTGDEPLGT